MSWPLVFWITWPIAGVVGFELLDQGPKAEDWRLRVLFDLVSALMGWIAFWAAVIYRIETPTRRRQEWAEEAQERDRQVRREASARSALKSVVGDAPDPGQVSVDDIVTALKDAKIL